MKTDLSTTMVVPHAVLTGDIVHSTAIPADLSNGLIRDLETAFGGNPFEFYRGDAFQVYVPDGVQALRMALHCRCLAIAISGDNAEAPGDVRIGIGIGDVEKPVGKLGTARGEAFLLSGRGFDGLADSGKRLTMSAAGHWPALSLAILSNEINGIFSTLTARQAEVLAEMLRGNTQRDTAQRLKKSQSTIHQHLVAARWPQIEDGLQHYQDIIKLLTETTQQ